MSLTILDNKHFPITIPNATQSADGAMSAADKAKLDGLPASSGTVTGGVQTVGAVTAVLSSFTPVADGTYTLLSLVSVLGDTDGDFGSYLVMNVFTKDGNVFGGLGPTNISSATSGNVPTIANANVSINIAGSVAQIQVTGSGGHTLRWSASTTIVASGPR